MTKRAKKAMMIGLDAPIAERMYDYAMGGELPNFKKCIDNGVWGKNCLNPVPTVTPPNWTALATGAWPSTHGITDFSVHVPGDPLNKLHMGFDTGEVQAEFIWQALQRVGKKSIVINWPTSWPPLVGDGWQVAGAGLGPNELAHGHWEFGRGFVSLAQPFLITNNEYRGAAAIEFEPVLPGKDWQGLPAGQRALQMKVDLPLRNGLDKMAPVTWYLAAVDTDRQGYDRVIVSESKNTAEALASLKVGEWSPLITREFQTEAGPKRAAFRMKLVELSPDANLFRLYVTGLAALDGFAHPAELSDELAELGELPFGLSAAFAQGGAGWFGMDTLVELWEMHVRWTGRVAAHLLKTRDWSFFAIHNHLPDYFYHAFSTRIEPTLSDERRVKQFQALELQMYKMIDSQMFGPILEQADAETVVVFVSDHGAKPAGRRWSVNRLLTQAGLQSSTEVEVQTPDGRTVKQHPIDWSKTKAYGQRHPYVYINLKGRDPDGMVEPAEYEKVQEEIIDALLSAKDPDGKRQILFALKKEDARFIGIYGDRVGDVVYALDPAFGGEHERTMPTARFGVGAIRSLFLMTGPGVKKGVSLDRNIWVMDVVPTLCQLTGWPIPEQCEGAIVYQALENPNE